MVNATTKSGKEKAEVLVNRVFADSPIKFEKDSLAIEEPLEIRIGFFNERKFETKAISITMRTPGEDFALAAGFLFTEGIIKTADEIENIKYCGKIGQPENTVRIDLDKSTKVDLKKLERHFYTTSSCGVCGKSSIEALSTGAQVVESNGFNIHNNFDIHSMPEKLRSSQSVFDDTGGLHAAGLFDREGNLLNIKEDVGRHNAVDKIIGSELLRENIPLSDKVLFLSGRASFELVQKAVMAQIPVIAAVSAPSSLAVSAAKEFNITLLGFVRDQKFNIYTGSKRIINET